MNVPVVASAFVGSSRGFLLLFLLGFPVVAATATATAAAAAATTTTNQQQQQRPSVSCGKLPRIEVQFLCDHDIEVGFDATDLLRGYYSHELFGNNDNDYNNNNDEDNTTLIANDTNGTEAPQSRPSPSSSSSSSLDLYVSVGLNRVEDVDTREWYYHRCYQSSNDTLATIDARGYYYYNYYNNDDGSDGSDATTTTTTTGTPSFDPPGLESYLRDHACGGSPLVFFRSSIRDWRERQYPVPLDGCTRAGEERHREKETDGSGNGNGSGNASSDHTNATNHNTTNNNDDDDDDRNNNGENPLVAGGGNRYYPSSSFLEPTAAAASSAEHAFVGRHDRFYYFDRYERNQRRHGYEYDHDLYLLCGGAQELDASNAFGGEGGEPSPFFLLLGVLSGYIMVLMIKAEFVRPITLPRSNRGGNRTTTSSGNDSGNGNDGNDDNDSGSESSVIATGRTMDRRRRIFRNRLRGEPMDYRSDDDDDDDIAGDDDPTAGGRIYRAWLGEGLRPAGDLREIEMATFRTEIV